MKDNNLLHEDVDLEELGTLTKNFTGAEIFGVFIDNCSFDQKRLFICI